MGLLMLALGMFVAVQFALTAAVYYDARRIRTGRLRRGIGPGVWACATLLGGAVAAAIYWKTYYSPLPSDLLASGKSR